MKKSNEILWLSIVQGWAILLVIIGHVNGYTYGTEGELYPVSDFLHRFCYSFHMPLFMFVSGGLLYLTRLNKGWKVSKLYVDKMKRLVLPYILFTIVGFLIKIPLSSVAKHGADVSVSGFFNAFFDPQTAPLKELWFVGTLIWLMAMYPVYRTMLKNPWTEIILLTITLIPFVSGLHFTMTGWFNLAGVSRFAFYFVAGMLFFKYDMYKYFERHLWSVFAAVGLYLAFFFFDIPELGFITATLGIVMSIAIGVRIVKLFPSIFDSFRDSSFQIFLVGLFPQMFVELIVWKHFHSEMLLFPFYVVSTLLALYAGVLVAKVGSRIPNKYVRWCLGLK